MSDETPLPVQQSLKYARQAMREGRRDEAWRQAKLASELAPNLEEPWLILGALAEPEYSIYYLQKALAINPDSEAARKGMQWAVQRLQEEPSVVGETPGGTQPVKLAEPVPLKKLGHKAEKPAKAAPKAKPV